MRPTRTLYLTGLLLAATLTGCATSKEITYGTELQGFEYPYPVKRFEFQSQGKSLQMGYMDVAAKGTPNGRSIVLMHGKNFCGATWEGSIKTLSDAGYRVVVPDQIGFCTSTKPDGYQYSFQQLALNTHQLLEKLGIKKATIMGHSTGGMLATRYALQYPTQTEQLVMVNSIGLEDWKALGVPYRTVDQWAQAESRLTYEGVRNYQQRVYYVGRWEPAYDRWVDMLVGLHNGPGRKEVAWNSALIYDMLFTQPVYYEFKDVQMPTLLLIGTSDTTAINSDLAPPEVKAKIGNYKVLGKQVAKLIPHATLVEFPGLGHSPQIEEPEQFHKALLQGLKAL
ncbi:alpha/beta fold hydrolase [Pseudomonas costantinii]|uniref:Alpha/beta hydrolase n=1 Tax=Pseudomonas costantinii TaxID=168469 RepID=A0A1S2V2F7_9PSED|nr:alpha/beta hydrolase [Pseudomonas costantinii]NVZ22699.1 alpha/beta hydrolase [Pseudomonas costantinii]OIN52897.1 alpha/beta hydrolase [Pseudomonas costantinii]SED28482.1 Pimeloyl-ACP methyl ester carboxylesterase [Pseudomonas costantinii]